MNKPANKKNRIPLLRRVLGIMLREYKARFGLVVLLILGAALATLRGTLFMRDLVDVYIKPMIGVETPDFGPLAHALFSLALVYLAGLPCSYGYNRIMAVISQGTLKSIRIQLFTRMESLPIQYFDTTPHGDIMSVYTNDVDTLRQLIGQSIPQLVNSTVTIVITLISMVCLNIPLTVLTLCMVAVMLAAASRLGGAAGTYFIKQQRSLGKVNAYIEEMMEGQKVVKVFCHERENIDAFRKINQELRESTKSANQIANILMPVNANLGNISYVLCAVLGAVLALNGMGSLTLGTLVSYLNLNRNFTQPVTQVSQQLNSIIMALAGAERIFQLLDEQPELDGGHVQLVNAKKRPDGSLMIVGVRTGLWAWRQPHSDGTVTLTELKGGIAFDDVDFGYSDEKIVLHNIRLFAEPGQKIAFVGSTGAGKTTITNLINRFYDIQDGKIQYDGININNIKKADLRRSLGIVLQDTHLFTGTVMENIRYGRLDATDGECVAAAKLSNADGFIRRLPDGYQTVLTGDGANLSQGQRQLIAIARAAVADPPVLILDEATSSIDTRTERLVQEGMDRLMKGRTTFVIAHRLSTVRNADCIMVLEQGRIIERGTHDQLMAEQGRYYQLYTGSAIA
ncbi:MAG: ABC transporter ATP-binding protein [Oscillibacter sp.]|nr:ABC transporter ATP-binding protein [Oscillibacter sp.]